MYILDSKDWRNNRAVGQERLFLDLWLEVVSRDVSPHYWSPPYSLLQLLRNLNDILADVQSEVLKEYHVKDGCEEIRDRFSQENWLSETYGPDINLLKHHLWRLEDSYSDGAIRADVSALIRPFLAKIYGADPIRQQMAYLAKLVANSRTSFAVIERAIGEVTNDLLHTGHARGYLHNWLIQNIIKDPKGRPYLACFQDTRALGQSMELKHEVLIPVQVPGDIPNTDGIRFYSGPPPQFPDPPVSRSTFSKKRFALVEVEKCLDSIGAGERGRRALRRYFGSTRLDHREFNRVIPGKVFVRNSMSGETEAFEADPPLRGRDLYNDDDFYRLPKGRRNEQTFAALDRILYWLEQSKSAVDETKLVALWTAMEFLFSLPRKETVDAMTELLPAYINTTYPRLILLDFWAFLSRANIVPEELKRDLLISAPKGGSRCDLIALFSLSTEDEATSRIKPLVTQIPILERKWRRVFRLKPGLVRGKASQPTIVQDLEQTEKTIRYDLRSCYRARNRIIHDAATDVAQLDKLSARLHWFVCTAVDALLFQFKYNRDVSLADLHAVNLASYRAWKERCGDLANLIAPQDLIHPRVQFLQYPLQPSPIPPASSSSPVPPAKTPASSSPST